MSIVSAPGLALLDRRRSSSSPSILLVPRASSSAYLYKVVMPRYPQAPEPAWPARSTGRSPSGSPIRVAGREPFAESLPLRLAGSPTSTELTAQAEELVGRATGLRSLAGPARARVTDRAGWVRANLASFQRLLRPAHSTSSTTAIGAGLARPRHPPGRRRRGGHACSAGCRAGCSASTTCWSSRRRTPSDQDLVYYVGPNVLALEKRFAFPPERVPAVAGAARGHPPGPVHRRAVAARALPRPRRTRPSTPSTPTPSGSSTASNRMADARALRAEPARRRRPRDPGRQPRAAGDPRPGERPDEPARGPRRRHHGPGRRGPGPQRRPLRPGAAPAPRRRRTGLTKLLQQLIGLEAKLNQYAQGEALHRRGRGRAGGTTLLDRAWEAPGQPAQPSLEIREPAPLDRAGGRRAPRRRLRPRPSWRS